MINENINFVESFLSQVEITAKRRFAQEAKDKINEKYSNMVLGKETKSISKFYDFVINQLTIK